MSQVQKLLSKNEISAKAGNCLTKSNEMMFNQSGLLHEMMKQCWGANFVSPIEQELKREDFKVLDVGYIEETKLVSPSSKRLLALFGEYLECKGISSSDNIMTEGIFDFLDATNLIGRIYSDERLVPIGNWGGDFGKLALKWSIMMFCSLKKVFVPLRMSEGEYERLLNQHSMENDYHSYLIFRRIYCQKNF
ncbi:3617_t:CDS:2 [Rhizophagus irregularis]|nr:3617_t:CDS:2 [Rhizophagus irregularis]